MSIPTEAVTSLLENIARIIKYNFDLVHDIVVDVQELRIELQRLESLMLDFEKFDSHDSHFFKSLRKEIKSIIEEAEDALDTYLVQVGVQKARNWICKGFHIMDYSKELRHARKKFQTITLKVKKIIEEKIFGVFQILSHQARARLGLSSTAREDPKIEEEHVVGFDGAINHVSNLLTSGSKKLEVISVVGMLGLGKTTLAKKVFTSTDVEYEYMIRVFVYVSRDYSRREVFLKILNSLKTDNDRVNQMTVDELERYLYDYLSGRQYLIVLDDIWEKEDWDRLKYAFPNENKRCRVLITTRNVEVAEYAGNSNTSYYKLDFLGLEESRELLRWKVFRDNVLPDKFNTYEEQIARKCDGLPLAISAIAGIIFNHRNNAEWWKRVAESMEDYIARDLSATSEIIELTYKHLPNHLKPCFLYLGLFPKDYAIPVWKLVRLWVAEGLIQNKWSSDLEDKAEEYLEELVCRNLVIVGQRKSNDKIKNCHIHDTLREFCKKEAAEENLFKEIKKDNLGSLFHTSSSLDEPRRLCLNKINVSDFLSSPPSGKCVRSLLSFNREETIVKPCNVSTIPKTFKLLKVLEFQSLKFQHLPSELKHLILLKYVAISFKSSSLPRTISALWNLQTLIVNSDSPVLLIEANIWKLPQFRHLHTNCSTILPLLDTHNPPKIGNVMILQDIRTLSTIAPESCTKECWGRSQKLNKLGIRGNLSELFKASGEPCLFSNLKDLTSLESLRLVNDETASKLDFLPSDISSLLQPLTKLTLLGTRLGWSEMQKLGKLENLEVLKVKDHAFEGKTWRTEPGGFSQLKHLHIGSTDLKEWEASADDFPRLKYIEVYFCYELKAIPGDFANITTLQSVVLHCTNSAVALSVSKLQEKMDNKFKVSVYP